MFDINTFGPIIRLTSALLTALILYFAVKEGVSKKLTIAAGVATALNCFLLWVWWDLHLTNWFPTI